MRLFLSSGCWRTIHSAIVLYHFIFLWISNKSHSYNFLLFNLIQISHYSCLVSHHALHWGSGVRVRVCVQVCAVASWDSSLHDLASLNRVTAVGDRLYMVVKVTVLLSHPASMELVLRKRIAIQIYRKQSLTFLTHKLRNKICDSVCWTFAFFG